MNELEGLSRKKDKTKKIHLFQMKKETTIFDCILLEGNHVRDIRNQVEDQLL